MVVWVCIYAATEVQIAKHDKSKNATLANTIIHVGGVQGSVSTYDYYLHLSPDNQRCT